MMTQSVWLRITGRKTYKWQISKVEVFARKKPSCNASQIAMKLSLEIPAEVFEETRYEMKAVLPMPAKHHVTDAELTKEVATALSAKMGMKVKVSMDIEAPKKSAFGDELKRL